MRCDRYGRRVRAAARGEPVPSAWSEGHLAHCLRCQAAVARERRTLRHMRALRQEVAPPPGLLERVLVAIERLDDPVAAPPHRRSRGRTVLRGLAAAGASAVAGAALVALSTHRGRRALGMAS